MLDYGIEIEFYAAGQTQATVTAAVQAAGVTCFAAGYSHTFEPTRWKVVSDGSLALGGAYGFELVSPPLTEAGFEQIEKVCATIPALAVRLTVIAAFTYTSAPASTASMHLRSWPKSGFNTNP